MNFDETLTVAVIPVLATTASAARCCDPLRRLPPRHHGATCGWSRTEK